MNATTLAGLISAIALALVAWFLGGRRKNDADTTETITRAAGEMIEQLRNELQRLVLEVGNLRNENAALHAQVNQLRAENLELAAVIGDLQRTVAGLQNDGR